MSLFRKRALDALSNPEKLDQPLRLLRARQWLLLLSLGGFCLSILTWSVLGRLPVRVSGRGVLVRQDSLKLVQSESTGRLQELAVEVGDCFEAGQLLARVEPLREQLEVEQARIKLAQLEQHDVDQDQLGAARMEQLRRSIERVDDLAAMGAFPIDELERRQQQMRDLEDSISSRNSQREQAITQQISRINALTTTIQHTASISAPVAGCIVDSSVHLDELVQPGATLFTLDANAAGSDLESYAYFPARDGKRLAVGQRVRISPTSTKPQRHGGIKGVVTAVKSLPVREDALTKRLGRPSLVAAVSGERREPLIEISTSLQRDPNTMSGYDWGGGPGPALKLSAGTPTNVRVLVEERRPISYVIPILRDLSGLY